MFRSLGRTFNNQLKRNPLRTNVLVYGAFYTAAEISQQSFNKFFTAEHPDYNFPALGRIVLVGSTLYAPTLYFWYKFLDKKLVGTAMKTVLTKVACDQLIATPTLLFLFYTYIAILERREDIFQELRQKYVKTFLANQTFWIPAQTINFSYVPPHLRVTYVASVSFIWINVLCYIKRQKVISDADDITKH